MNRCLSRFCSAAVLFFSISSVWARPFETQHVMIVGESPLAVEAGKKAAERGGNVVDVAVAVALTASVTNPAFASFGGGGFALVKVGSGVEALDFRETAPSKTDSQFFINRPKEASVQGGTAVAVPGMVAGLWALHKKYGNLKWSQLFGEAIDAAEHGYFVTSGWVYEAGRAPFDANGKKLFMRQDGKSFLPGDKIRQPQVVKLLKVLQAQGMKGFYSGSVAADIVQTVEKSGGVLSRSDLSTYNVRWLQPIVTAFKGTNVYLMPPPSSGGVVVKSALDLIEKIKLETYPRFSAVEYHLLGEILSRSFQARSLLGDPDFNKNPIDYIFSERYESQMRESINPKKKKTTPSLQLPLSEGANTGHFNIMDSKGHAVAITLTLNSFFGSGVVTPKFGIVLNNEMDDFTTRPEQANQFGLVQGQGNLIQPNKRPLSSMTPTLVEKDGRIILALGAPGGPRIISSIVQTLFRALSGGLNIEEAMDAPRVHHQYLPDLLHVDQNRFSPEVIQGLQKMGHVIKEFDPFNMGRVTAIRWNEKNLLEGAWDRRGEGAVSGY